MRGLVRGPSRWLMVTCIVYSVADRVEIVGGDLHSVADRVEVEVEVEVIVVSVEAEMEVVSSRFQLKSCHVPISMADSSAPWFHGPSA